MKKIILLCVLAALTACNTMEGVGQDVKGAGQWTSDSAEKVKHKM